MINNFLVHEYHPSDVVYTHEQSGHLLHLGDISAALDTDAIKHHAITTGTPDHMQSSRQRQAWNKCSSTPQSLTSYTRCSI